MAAVLLCAVEVLARPQVVASLDVALPAPLDVSAAERWGELLGWDEATRSAVAEQIRAFLAERQADLDQVIAPVVELTRGVSSTSLYTDPQSLESLKIVLRARHRAVSALLSREEELFRRLADTTDLLRPEDVEAARQLRRRDRFEDFPCATRLAAIDLRRIRVLLERDAPLEIGDEAAWEAAWVAHDHEMAELHDRRVRDQLDAGAADVEAFQRSDGDMQAFVADRSIRFRSRLRIDRSIRAANERWTNALAEALTPESAQRLRETVEVALFPEIFPDRFSLLPVVETIAIAHGVPPESAIDMRSMLELEIALVRSREEDAQRVLVEIEEFEALAIVDQGRRERRATAIEGLWALRREAASRALAALEAAPALNGSTAAQRLRSALEPAQGKPGESEGAGLRPS